MTKKNIALWSGPRNLSTALMYSFINRGDCKAYDEPLFGYFLKQTGVWRPSRDEVMNTFELDSKKVIENCFESENKNGFVFTKNIANHVVDLDLSFLLNQRNIVLTRHPYHVLKSYTKNIDQPTLLDLAYQQQLEIIDYLKKNKQPYLLIEAKDIKRNPELALKALCDFCDITFTNKMLKWASGKRSEDGPWDKYWYQNVHKSTAFISSESTTFDNSEYKQNKMYQKAVKQYQQLVEHKTSNQ